MAKTVKAAVVAGPKQVEIRQFSYPRLEEGGAIMKSLMSGICGTDKHSYRGETKQNTGTDTEFHAAYPYIQGHEAVGVIEEISREGAKNLDYYGEELKVGDRVTFCPDIVCGKCYYCRHASWYPWCEDPSRECYGNSLSCDVAPHLFGAFAEYMYLLPRTYVYKVPEYVSNEMACLAELMSVTYTLDKAKELFAFDGEGFGFGGTVVVQGVGPLGLAHVIKARMMGAGTIIATDLSGYKLNLAKEFGADITLNVKTTDVKQRLEAVRQASHGLGADVVAECTGVPAVVPEGLQMVRKAGVYLECGHFVDMGPTEVNMAMVCGKNLRIIGMNNHAVTGYRPSMEMMHRTREQFPWMKFFSHRFYLDDYDEAIRTSQTEESMKVLVECWK
ncbi:MAG: zinc-binding dehydrogenase [Planctomycetaceae bacterium]|nr:zinc-binding dehydrogenase [Planctomycetaceae bacterium]